MKSWYAKHGHKQRAHLRQLHIDKPQRSMFRDAGLRAKRKAIPFEITVDDIVVPHFCPILDIPLIVGPGKSTSNSPSLDRIIPELGYVKGNIQVISHLANKMKNNATFDQMIQLGKWAEKMKVTT
jgi:hypothetical protein